MTPQNYANYHGLAKSIHVMVLTGLFVLVLYLVTKLHDSKTALIFGILFAFETYVIAINRWFHLTSMEVLFAFAAYLSVLLWAKLKQDKYLMLSAVSIGLAALTKVSSVIILPLIFYIILKNKPKKMAVYLLAAGGTFFILFPAMWVTPGLVLAKITGAISTAVSSDERIYMIWDGIKPVFYSIMVAAKLTPAALVLVLIGIYKLAQKSVRNSSVKSQLVAYGFPLVFTYILLSFSAQKIDRYVLALFPYLFMLVALGVEKCNTKILSIVFTIYIAQATLLYCQYFPVVSEYTSPVVGGPAGLHKLSLYDNSGEYFAQAAQYINSICPKCTVYVPNNTDAFSPYFLGRVTQEYGADVKYEVKSIDMERSAFTQDECNMTVKLFGQSNFKPVGVFSCATTVTD